MDRTFHFGCLVCVCVSSFELNIQSAMDVISFLDVYYVYNQISFAMDYFSLHESVTQYHILWVLYFVCIMKYLIVNNLKNFLYPHIFRVSPAKILRDF